MTVTGDAADEGTEPKGYETFSKDKCYACTRTQNEGEGHDQLSDREIPKR